MADRTIGRWLTSTAGEILYNGLAYIATTTMSYLRGQLLSQGHSNGFPNTGWAALGDVDARPLQRNLPAEPLEAGSPESSI